ncbi:hypothetical protein C8R45DRAFT_1056282 [Mycena sanguinolenta]|nr:hypothetical protein C8R45DRAFT_1056282 [Mycena sanguinolenta]
MYCRACILEKHKENPLHQVEIQLLRAGWFPATHKRLQTCATVAILEKFHQDTLESKMTMYDFYGVLEKLTNNTGIKPPDRYHKWIRMCQEFRHLMLLKRRGRATAYSVSGVEGTQQGELAIQVLYTIYIALDACFRLKRQLVSSELKDPDLGSGWAYMVETEPYREYLRNITPQKEMDTCSGLAALDYANTKFSRGYSTTGVGMGVCARHEFVLANGVGDLQKGEHFSNMDYVLASILKHIHALLFKFFTYDIACIWKIALHERLKKLPPNVDAEAIERAWAAIGGVATSTQDMGPGARHDVLDCQFNYWNWQKLVGIVELLRRRLDRAREELQEQTESLEEFSAQQTDRVPEWRRQVLEFEQDKTKFNPFHVEMKGLTEAQVRLQFTKEEADKV